MMPTLNEQNEIGQLVAGLSAAISGMRLYAEKHPKTIALLDQAYAGIAQRATSREKTTAMIVDDELLWDGTALKGKVSQLPSFVKELRAAEIESISFHKGITRSEITDFLKTLASNQADSLPSSTAHVKLGKLRLSCKEPDLCPLGESDQQRVAAFLALRDKKYPQVREISHGISRRRNFEIKGVEDVVTAFVRGFVHNINPIRLLVQMKVADEYTYTHMVNVCILTVSQAESLGFPAEYLFQIGVAAILHDAGKLFIPAEILNKPGKLTNEERLIVETHSLRGASYILKHDAFPKLAVLGALEHHIKYDGTGYPAIPTSYQPNIISQMIAISDVFDAMRTRRSYKEPKPVKDIAAVLLKEKGSAYHPRLVDNFLKLIQEEADGRRWPPAPPRSAPFP
jgi:HD-GYP domain-containing protein (c-di-GMP phosphodiesterase class II)